MEKMEKMREIEIPVYTRKYLKSIRFSARSEDVACAFVWADTVEGQGFWANEFDDPTEVGLRIWDTMRKSARYYEEKEKNQ